MKAPLYRRLAELIVAIDNCTKTNNHDWRLRHRDAACALASKHLPSGSGFDKGTRLDVVRSTADKLVFVTSFHHMNENGYYDGWTEHTVVVTPSLAFGFDMKVTGDDRAGINDDIVEIFALALNQEVEASE